MIDEVDRARRLADELGDDIAAADKQRRGTIADIHLQRARRFGLPLIRGNHELRTGLGCLERQRKCGRAGALRRRMIVCGDNALQIERAGDDARVETIEKWKARRGEMQCGDLVATALAEAIAGGGDRHRDAVLVPVRHRALAFGARFQSTVEPAIRLCNRSARQPPQWDVTAIAEYAARH